MSNIIETGIEQEKWSMTLGAKTANTIPYRWIAKEFQEQRGPVWCPHCKEDGSFEGIFYASCDRCSLYEGRCLCVYCIAAKKDGHNHLTRRANIFRFVKELQMVIEDLRRDYPGDEYGIVAEGIETGFYILNLHTAKQYELMLLDITPPFEVSQLSIGELTYRWNPERDVPETVIRAAVKAAKRLGILPWTKELWSGTKYEVFLATAEEFTPEELDMDELSKKICSPAISAEEPPTDPLEAVSEAWAAGGAEAIEEPPVWHSEWCDHKVVHMDFRGIAYCCPFDLWHKEKLHTQEKALELAERKLNICDQCGDIMPRNGGKCTGFECADDDEDFDVQCQECDTWVSVKETDERDYCKDCQNPEYDPVWPMGD